MKKTLILIFCLAVTLICAVGCQKISKEEGNKLKDYLTLQEAPEDARPYLQGREVLTADALIKISEKGEEISLDDFKNYRCDFYSNSSSYLFEYRLNDVLTVDFIADLKNPEKNEVLLLCDSDGSSIDIRKEKDVAAFIGEKLKK